MVSEAIEAVTPEEAAVVAATEVSEIEEAEEEEVHAVDQEADHQDHQCLSDKDRSRHYEEAHHDRLHND